MVCEQCQHPNPESGRFCGLCGEPLVRRTAELARASRSQTISGPSFLGLSDDDPAQSPLNYLLDDDPPRHSRGPIFLTLVLIAVIGGIGYLYWHNVYAPLAYTQPPTPRTVPPPAFAYDITPPVVFANAQLAQSMSILALPNRNGFDQLRLERISADQKAETEAADPRNNPSLLTGEKYLYGRGVVQNCRQAVSNFEAAAKQNNAPALAHLGVMSASGHCMKLDRVAAYQWFARAKQADPNNLWLDRSMDMLWANMSHRERNAVMK